MAMGKTLHFFIEQEQIKGDYSAIQKEIERKKHVSLTKLIVPGETNINDTSNAVESPGIIMFLVNYSSRFIEIWKWTLFGVGIVNKIVWPTNISYYEMMRKDWERFSWKDNNHAQLKTNYVQKDKIIFWSNIQAT